MMPYTDTRHTLLLVDDEPVNLQVLRHTLQDNYRLLFAKDGQKALELAQSERPDMILLDIMMPETSGYDVCRALKQDDRTKNIPVIFITALTDVSNEEQGLSLGAVDYITKPFRPAIVKARIRTHLSLVQATALRDTRLQIIQCLGVAAEYKDHETGLHVIRMSNYSYVLALAAGYSQDAAETLLHAAPMHDVGKIGIPDTILRKPDKLTQDEWVIMQQHTTIGAKIIGQHESSLLQMSRSIALNHHEKWDGSGYPNHLSREEIPHEARIIALADVFDALTNPRPYKTAWPVDKAIEFICSEKGKHFDPALIPLFLESLPQFMEIKAQWAEESAPSAVCHIDT